MPLRLEVPLGRRTAALAEGEVVLVGAAIVGVAVDADVQCGLGLQVRNLRVERLLRVGAQVVLVEVEVDGGCQRRALGGGCGLAGATGGFFARGGVAARGLGARDGIGSRLRCRAGARLGGAVVGRCRGSRRRCRGPCGRRRS